MDTKQLTFLLYLLLGQAVLLGLWSLLRRAFAPRSPAPSEVPAPESEQRGERLLRVGFALCLLAWQVVLLVGWNRMVEMWEASDVVTRADLVVTLHFVFVLFVLLLQILVLVGWPLGWNWTRNFWLRLAQILCIEIVAGQAIVALECPLTSLERDLRGSLRQSQPGDAELSENEIDRAKLHHLEGASAVGRFCHRLLFYRIPPDTYAYVAGGFGLLVFLTWLFVPPRMPGYPAVAR